MFERLETILETYYRLEKELLKNLEIKELTRITKEISNIKETVEKYLEYKDVSKQIKDLQELLEIEEDQEMINISKEEIKNLENKLEELEYKLKILLLPSDPNDDKNVIVEIKGAVGGDEANIFAGDLFRMYSKYADTKNWKVELLNQNPGTKGGFSNLEFLVKGDKVYSFLKYESGPHRVQRVPETESQGRVHTSTATVYVMPEAADIDVDVSWDDIKVDTYNSSGPGGQSVNTTKSAVRLTHIPTNLVVSCQDGKSQHENKDKAYMILKARIYDKILQEKEDQEGSMRRSLIGHGKRSEKIRTYNYPQNRVTDHRINLTLQRLDSIVEGNLDLVIEPLLNYMEKEQLENENK